MINFHYIPHISIALILTVVNNHFLFAIFLANRMLQGNMQVKNKVEGKYSTYYFIMLSIKEI